MTKYVEDKNVFCCGREKKPDNNHGYTLMNKKIGLYISCILMTVSLLFNYLYNGDAIVKPPQVVQGVLDLRSWDLADGVIKLDGEWEFYWQQLLEPADFRADHLPIPVDYFTLPNMWNHYKSKESETGDGYATYRVNIKFDKPARYLTLTIPDVATAYNLYINGELVSSVGIVGEGLVHSKPKYLPQIVSFYTDRQDVELVIQVSNFAHQRGGIKSSLELGLGQEGYKLHEQQMGFGLFILGIIFIMAVYHFGLYLMRRKDKPAFYFGLFCLLIAIRALATGQIFMMSIFPGIEWEILIKIEYLSYYLSVPLFVKFIYHLYAAETSPRRTNYLMLASLLFSGVVMLTPVKVFVQTLPWYHGIAVLACVYISIMVIRAVRNKQEGAGGCFVLGIFIFIGTVVNDILLAQGIITTREMVPIGLFIFIFFQALALSTRFAKAYATLEIVSTELRYSTEILKEQVRLLDLDPDYSFERNLEGVIVFWNHGAELGYDWTKEEAVGQVAYRLLKTQFPEPLTEINDKLMSDGRWMGELVQTKRDGSTVVVRNCCLLKRGVDGNPMGVLEFNKDITEQKNLEKGIARLDRLNIIGKMAASMSHEVRNPMTTVRGFLQLLAKKEYNGKYKEYYELMLSELDRANDILTEYLSVARPRDPDFKMQDLNKILISLQPLLQADAHKIGKIFTFDLGVIPESLLDDGEIRQLILNLCRNGLEAMSEGGKTVTVTTFLQGDEVILSITDEGPGISEEMIEKLGTPFLSTKDNGTGLGLAVCYGIVAKHKATMEVSTSPTGTTFLVKFR